MTDKTERLATLYARLAELEKILGMGIRKGVYTGGDGHSRTIEYNSLAEIKDAIACVKEDIAICEGETPSGGPRCTTWSCRRPKRGCSC